jgi:acyl-CoA reductase-like NAD-dependent aldehyde dehydrogenase
MTEQEYTVAVQQAFAALDQVVDACWKELKRKPSARKVVLRDLRSLLYSDADALAALLREVLEVGMAVQDTNGDANRIISEAMNVADYIDSKLKKGLKLV